MKKTAQTGDSHFDSSPNGRLDECIRLHDWMVEDWARRDVGLVLHGGDLFEGLGTTTSPERMAAARFLRRAAALGPVVCLRGNHDPLGELLLYAMLDAPHPIIAVEDVRMLRFKEADVEVVCVPWPRRGLGLYCAEGRRSTADQDVRQAIVDMMRFYGAAPRQCSRRIVISHAMISGATTSTGQPLVGIDCEIAVEDLALAEPDVILLSHVHKGQGWNIVTPAGRKIRAEYAGSNRRTDFGEVEEKHYLLVDDLGRDDARLAVAHVPVPATPLLLMKWLWRTDLQQFLCMDGPIPGPWAPLGPAQCRLQATIPDDQRDAARAHLKIAAAEAALAHVELTIEEIPVVVQRARAPEIVAAATVAEQALIALRATGRTLEPIREARVLKLATEIDVAVAVRTGPRGRKRGGIRLRRLRGSDIGPFGEFDLDLEKVRGPIVAVHGANEAGKSTLLECFPGLCFRKTVTRDSLRELATSDRSILAGSFDVGGRTFDVTHRFDKAREKFDATVFDDTGRSYTPGAKVTELDAWSTEYLPPMELFLAAQFSAQGKGGFLALGDAKRKEMVQRALGIDGIELRAVYSRKLLDGGRTSIEVVDAKLQQAAKGGGDVDALERDHADAVLHVEQCEALDRIAERNLQDVEQLAREAEWARASWNKAAAEMNEKRKILAGWRAQMLDLRASVEEADAARAKLPAYAEMRAALSMLRPKVTAVAEKLATADAEQRAKVAGADAARKDAGRAANDASAAKSRLDGAVRREQAAIVTRLQADLYEPMKARDDETKAAYQEAKAKADAIAEARSTFAHQRAKKLRTGHEQIVALDETTDDGQANDLHFAGEISAAAIAADDAGLKTSDPNALATALRDVEVAATARETARMRLAEADKARELLKGLGDVVAARTTAQAEFDAAQKHMEETRAKLVDAGVLQKLRMDFETAQAEHRKRLEEQAELERKLAYEQADMRTASGRDALVRRHDEIVVSCNELAPKVDGVAMANAPAAPSDTERVLAAEARRSAAEAARTAQRAVADLAARLTAARAAAVDVAKLKGDRAELMEYVADLALLAELFGREGIQAFLVDAAIPELAAITNDLLHSCFGTRWTVRLVTQRQLAGDADRNEEVFAVRVLDGKNNVERDAKSNSGGAKVPIGEALSLALTVIACERSAVDRPTLVRDESAAALDSENAKAYVAMLRRAAARIGAEHVLLVSHNPSVWELADSKVRVSGGTIVVE